MLFAAGFGTRMGALTAHQPKPLIKVAGKALIDHAIDLIPKGIKVVANAHYLSDQIRSHLSPKGIAISDESDAILETGGGLRRALPLLGKGSVYTLNTDAVWHGENPLERLSQDWDGSADALLLLAPADQLRGHKGKGDFTLHADGTITRGGPLTYLGAQIINPKGIEAIAEDAFSLNRLWDQMIATGRAKGTLYSGLWCDVGRPEGILEAEAMLKEPL